MGPLTDNGDNRSPFPVLVRSVRWETPTILVFQLERPDGEPLPAFTAGAHIDVHLPNGLVRSYSLLGDQSDSGRYLIGVHRDEQGRGGSSWMHRKLHAGQIVEIDPPRNAFSLVEDAVHTVLIAGGIGITPLLSMARRLTALGKPWTFYLAVRDESAAPFVAELTSLAVGSDSQFHLHVDAEAGGFFDLAAAIESAPAGAHVYCCGPPAMLASFEELGSVLPADRRHVEYFAAKEDSATEGGFEVELSRSGVVLTVAPGTTVLDTILDSGIDIPFSCSEGICGTCETKVISGVPDHRDSILTEEERASNTTMMICCSGSLSARLVLDR